MKLGELYEKAQGKNLICFSKEVKILWFRLVVKVIADRAGQEPVGWCGLASENIDSDTVLKLGSRSNRDALVRLITEV